MNFTEASEVQLKGLRYLLNLGRSNNVKYFYTTLFFLPVLFYHLGILTFKLYLFSKDTDNHLAPNK